MIYGKTTFTSIFISFWAVNVGSFVVMPPVRDLFTNVKEFTWENNFHLFYLKINMSIAVISCRLKNCKIILVTEHFPRVSAWAQNVGSCFIVPSEQLYTGTGKRGNSDVSVTVPPGSTLVYNHHSCVIVTRAESLL